MAPTKWRTWRRRRPALWSPSAPAEWCGRASKCCASSGWRSSWRKRALTARRRAAGPRTGHPIRCQRPTKSHRRRVFAATAAAWWWRTAATGSSSRRRRWARWSCRRCRWCRWSWSGVRAGCGRVAPSGQAAFWRLCRPAAQWGLGGWCVVTVWWLLWGGLNCA